MVWSQVDLLFDILHQALILTRRTPKQENESCFVELNSNSGIYAERCVCVQSRNYYRMHLVVFSQSDQLYNNSSRGQIQGESFPPEKRSPRLTCCIPAVIFNCAHMWKRISRRILSYQFALRSSLVLTMGKEKKSYYAVRRGRKTGVYTSW